MGKSKRPRMKHRARRFNPGTRVVADVNALAHQRMAELGEVDSNLMLATGFEAALDERRTLERGDRLHVCDRALCIRRRLTQREDRGDHHAHAADVQAVIERLAHQREVVERLKVRQREAAVAGECGVDDSEDGDRQEDEQEQRDDERERSLGEGKAPGHRQRAAER